MVKEREKNINVWLPLTRSLLGTWPATQACAPTGSQTSNPLARRLALNPLSHTSRVSPEFLVCISEKQEKTSPHFRNAMGGAEPWFCSLKSRDCNANTSRPTRGSFIFRKMLNPDI